MPSSLSGRTLARGCPTKQVCSTLTQTPRHFWSLTLLHLGSDQSFDWKSEDCRTPVGVPIPFTTPRDMPRTDSKACLGECPRRSLRSDPKRNLREYLLCCSSVWVLRMANKFLSRVLPCSLLLLLQSPVFRESQQELRFQGIWTIIPHVFAPGDFSLRRTTQN